MATLKNLKIKTSTCKRILKELHSYEKEVERETAKTANMKEKGADPYDLKQQLIGMETYTVAISEMIFHDDVVENAFPARQTCWENVLAESRMMVPDCHKRLEASFTDLKALLEELKESNQQGPEIDEAHTVIGEVEALFLTTEA
ncbi:hypothetical protein ACLOJK_034023 [Asimina triloba]